MIQTSDINAASEKQVALKMGNRAPFHGVLVPEDMFRIYQVNDFEVAILRDQSAACEKAMEDKKPDTNIFQPLYFIGGLIIGGYAVAHLK